MENIFNMVQQEENHKSTMSNREKDPWQLFSCPTWPNWTQRKRNG